MASNAAPIDFVRYVGVNNYPRIYLKSSALIMVQTCQFEALWCLRLHTLAMYIACKAPNCGYLIIERLVHLHNGVM